MIKIWNKGQKNMWVYFVVVCCTMSEFYMGAIQLTCPSYPKYIAVYTFLYFHSS